MTHFGTTPPHWRYSRRVGIFAAALLAAYAVVLSRPELLFAHELRHAGIVQHANRPIPAATRTTLERASLRLERSPLHDPSLTPHVFICDQDWLFALFARTNYKVGGVADLLSGDHVFLRRSDMDHDRLIGPSGQTVAADRPLSYFIAHEIMHLLHARALGRWGYLRLPSWVDDGDADYVARDIDYAVALRGLQNNAGELDPVRSGLYVKYHLMVAYALEKRHIDPRTLLFFPPSGPDIERELRALRTW